MVAGYARVRYAWGWDEWQRYNVPSLDELNKMISDRGHVYEISDTCPLEWG